MIHVQNTASHASKLRQRHARHGPDTMSCCCVSGAGRVVMYDQIFRCCCCVPRRVPLWQLPGRMPPAISTPCAPHLALAADTSRRPAACVPPHNTGTAGQNSKAQHRARHVSRTHRVQSGTAERHAVRAAAYVAAFGHAQEQWPHIARCPGRYCVCHNVHQTPCGKAPSHSADKPQSYQLVHLISLFT